MKSRQHINIKYCMSPFLIHSNSCKETSEPIHVEMRWAAQHHTSGLSILSLVVPDWRPVAPLRWRIHPHTTPMTKIRTPRIPLLLSRLVSRTLLPRSRLHWSRLPWSRLPWSRLPWSNLPWSQLPWSQLPWSQLPWSKLPWLRLPRHKLSGYKLPGHCRPGHMLPEHWHWLSQTQTTLSSPEYPVSDCI